MAKGFSQSFKQACGRVQSGNHSGTGYLIGPDRVITCAHVVAGKAPIVVYFGEARYDAEIGPVDSESDCALLTLQTPITGIEPLRLGGRCRVKSDWYGYGFPIAASGAGLALAGVVRDPDATDDLGAPVLQLASPEVAAGMAAPLHGFSGSPVVVDGVVVGHLKRFVPDPDEPFRPAYGMVYAVPATAVSRLIGATPGAPVVAPATNRPQTRHATTVFNIWKGWRDAGVGDGANAIAAAEGLIAHGRMENVLQVLEFAPAGVRKEQLHALVLTKTGDIDRAIQVLEQLRTKDWLDAETGGLLGGCYKQKWQASGDRRFLRLAFRVYQDTFDKTERSYPGINAAGMSLLLGERKASRETAKRVLKCENLRRPDNDFDQWELATVAEAQLLLGKNDEARTWYERAVLRDSMAMENIAVMRRQARAELAAFGLPAGSFDDVLSVPRVVAFTGHMTDAPDRAVPRFPPKQQPAVRDAIRQRLLKLGVGYGFSSAARGGDLLFLEELLQRQGRARVFLPFPADSFAGTSVGYGWDARYQKILAHDSVDVTVLAQQLPSEEDQPATFARCNEVIASKAIEFAERLDERPILLVVWNGEPSEGDGGTKDAIEAWRQEGRDVEIIDISKL